MPVGERRNEADNWRKLLLFPQSDAPQLKKKRLFEKKILQSSTIYSHKLNLTKMDVPQLLLLHLRIGHHYPFLSKTSSSFRTTRRMGSFQPLLLLFKDIKPWHDEHNKDQFF